ncbi:MAG: hypothetical protein AB8E87_13440, partial [Prochlorococcus sp.]
RSQAAVLPWQGLTELGEPHQPKTSKNDQAGVPGAPDLLTTTTREWLRARNPSLLRQPKGLNETGNQH